MKTLCAFALLVTSCFIASAQDTGERRVALTDTAVALDAAGTSVLEGTLRTTSLNG